MSSARLPGKVLLELNQKPLLSHVVERVRQARRIDALIVATSDDPSDDVLAHFCQDQQIACYRGSLDDPSQRIGDVVRSTGCVFFARVCADSPLYDPVLLDQAFETIAEENADLVTNVCPRTFPRGQSVEVLRSEFYLEHLPLFDQPGDKEHVTQYFYRKLNERPGDPAFRVSIIGCPEGDLSDINLCIDTPADRLRLENLLKKIDGSVARSTRSELQRLYRDVVQELKTSGDLR